MPTPYRRTVKQELAVIEAQIFFLKTEIARLERQAANFKGVIKFYEDAESKGE